MIHIRISHYTLKDLDGIYILSQVLAHYFPVPEQYVTGIYELLLNAMEHGNLGIGFQTKTELLRQGKWKEEVARRLALPEYANKEIEIKISYDEQECRLVIADHGNGFNWKEYMEHPAEGRLPNGRGLWIALNANFDSITFNAIGNQVICIAQYSSDQVTLPNRSTNAASLVASEGRTHPRYYNDSQ